MPPYDHIRIIDGLLDAVASVVCTEALFNLKGIGVFLDENPGEDRRTITAALRRENNYLGLASWSLTPLYVEGKRRLRIDADDFEAASALLVATPDYITGWNVRKRKLQLDDVSSELLFSELMILRSPKSAESWSHRAWVLREMMTSAIFIKDELELAWTAAMRAQSNYYVGVHRLRVLQEATDHIFQLELHRSAKWLRANVFDASGWWYHRHLLEKLLKSGLVSEDAEIVTHSEWLHSYVHLQCVKTYQSWLLRRRVSG